MKRKILLSYLGTGDYIPCKYTFNGQQSELVPYVQEALCDLFELNSQPHNKIYIFLTEAASAKHWDNPDKDVLKDRLHDKLKKAEFEGILIPDGKNETELWKIFDTVFGQIKDNDEIILDITHSYRSLPTFSTVLLEYARLIKNVTIKGIYYGALESLGTPKVVKDMPLEKRCVPIFDLYSFSVLQQWSSYAESFIAHGSAVELSALLRREIRRLEVNNPDVVNELRKLASLLDQMTEIFTTVRGKAIYEGSVFIEISDAINSLLKSEYPFKALFPILEKIRDKIAGFKSNDIMNGFKAVAWCISNNMVQQGFTLLQEFIVIFFIAKYEGGTAVTGNNQQLVRDVLNLSDPYKVNVPHQKADFFSSLVNDISIGAIKQSFNMLTKCRNELNHIGSFKKANDVTVEMLKKYYKAILPILTSDKNTWWL